ncbi:tRNA lysidine(34) synthetase TilS [Flavobacterium sp.]|jgi:tRNA(Ile)-lysidine synthase|uniref:tRNA lysidine(34) synthetase TilS n=1 Tax=Flavobacterium sp. TaxID=239 RepID=UPI002A802FC1|nr:tRNA lysidine(34) synthetase TilS [Flavobacterium sp.]
MIKKIQLHLENNFPHLKGKKLLLATSGGIDSMVLVHLFHALNYQIGIAHCNFQLRGNESDEDERFVKQFAHENQIPFNTISFQTEKYANENKLSIQLAARKLRYDWFNEVLAKENYDYITTAHHLDDQVETFLINFTRGTGLEGLTGIPSQKGTIIRPLLPFSREEIENYVYENGITWREDTSNASDKYLRNKLRHNIIPILKELNPSFLDSFQNTLNHLKQTNELAEDASKMVYEKVVKEFEGKKGINLTTLLQFKNHKSYLYQWLNKFGFTAWYDVYDLVNAQSGKQIFSNTHILLKDRESLLLYSKPIDDVIEEYIINEDQKSLKFPLNINQCKVDNISITTNNVIFVDENKIQFPLVIRKKQEGDSFYPSGMKGKKKLSKYFKDEKYSLIDKENQWLLTSNNEIVWVIGKRADQQFLANETTQNIIKIEITE